MPTTADRPRLLFVACAFALIVSGAELLGDCARMDADDSTPARTRTERGLDTRTADLLPRDADARDMPRMFARRCSECVRRAPRSPHELQRSFQRQAAK